MPVLGGQESESGCKNSDFFPAGATFNYTNSVGAIFAKEAGVKKMAAVYCVEVAICAESVHQGEQVAAHHGIKYAYVSSIGFAAPNYTAQCLAAKQSGATAMTVGDASSVVEHVVTDCAAQGYTPRQLSGDGTVAGRLAEDPGLQRQHRLPGGQPVVPPQLRYIDDVQGTGQVRAGVTTGPTSVRSCCSPGRTVPSCRPPSRPPGPRPPRHSPRQTFSKVCTGSPSGETLGGLSPRPALREGPAGQQQLLLRNGHQERQVRGPPRRHDTVRVPLVKAGTLPTTH